MIDANNCHLGLTTFSNIDHAMISSVIYIGSLIMYMNKIKIKFETISPINFYQILCFKVIAYNFKMIN